MIKVVSKNTNNPKPLARKVQAFILNHQQALAEILDTMLRSIIYEDSKVMWVFSKPLLPTILINKDVI
jgi:hypothetical protein